MSIINQNSSSQAIAYLVEDEKIMLQIHKYSTNTNITNNNSCYSLAGAVYGVYTDAACTKKVSRRDIDLSYVTDSKLTLYAGWSDIRTIYFDSKTTQILPKVEYHIGDTVKLADLPTPDAPAKAASLSRALSRI